MKYIRTEDEFIKLFCSPDTDWLGTDIDPSVEIIDGWGKSAPLNNFRGDLSHWNMSHVKLIKNAFHFDLFPATNILSWDLSNVEVIKHSFHYEYGDPSIVRQLHLPKLAYVTRSFYKTEYMKLTKEIAPNLLIGLYR